MTWPQHGFAVVVLAVAFACFALRPGPLFAVDADVGDALAALLSTRVEEAEALLAGVPEREPGRDLVQSALHFYQGRYAESVALLPALGSSPEPLERALTWLWDRAPAALSATAGMVEAVEGHFAYRFEPGPDTLLFQYGMDALEEQREVLGKLLGEFPPGPTVVEFFPSVDRFVEASGLPREWVETTGTVAVCKWDRILVLSPRNMPRGYPWKDTLAHEYVHLALSRATNNRAPIWFQEGTARIFEGAWRGSARRDFIDPWSETLLARAAASDQWISFEQMHPSMAALPSSEAAALAFAQVAWSVDLLLEEAGQDGFRRVVELIRREGDALGAVETVLGPMGGAFEGRTHRYIRSRKPQVRAAVAELGLDLGEGQAAQEDERGVALDPVLLADEGMKDHTRIGDLLRLRGHPEAAIIEYDRAAAVGPFHSPALANKQARALRALGDVGRAEGLLRESVDLYPDYTPTVALLAELAGQRGEDLVGATMGERALALNPFDPAVHRHLVGVYERLGRPADAERERKMLGILGEAISPVTEK